MLDQVLDTFVSVHPIELSVVLLQLVADPEQGGRGYHIRFMNPMVDLDGWEVDHSRKLLLLDQTGLFSSYTNADHARHLREAIETEFLKTRATLLEQYGWGTGKVLLGVVETATGVIGIIVPEPTTTVAGVVAVGLGANTIADGISQLAGAGQGNGINLLSELAGQVGAKVSDLATLDPEVGRNVGKGVFLVSSIALGSVASLKILSAPGKSMVALGVGGRPGGLQLGRVNLLYSSERAKDGLTIMSITNNKGQSILRFVTHGGRLVVNGRIVGVEGGNILKHETDAKVILKGLLKLMSHGAKQ